VIQEKKAVCVQQIAGVDRVKNLWYDDGRLVVLIVAGVPIIFNWES